MAWFKVDDGFYDHRKVIALKAMKGWERALGLWLVAGAWCSKQESDGHLSSAEVKHLGFAAKDAQLLVDCKLWETGAVCAYVFHDWADWNPTRAQLEAERLKTKERVTKWRKDRAGNGVGNSVCNTVTPPVTPALVTPPPTRPDPTRPDPTEHTAREDRVKPFGFLEAKDAMNAARSSVGVVMHMSRDEETALIKYAETVANLYPDPAGHVKAAHAAWLATEGAKAEFAKRRPVSAWMANPDAALLASKARKATWVASTPDVAMRPVDRSWAHELAAQREREKQAQAAGEVAP